MLNLLNYIGNEVSLTLVLIVFVTLLGYVHVCWQCELCGKTNTTNFFKFLFCMCDHRGV